MGIRPGQRNQGPATTAALPRPRRDPRVHTRRGEPGSPGLLDHEQAALDPLRRAGGSFTPGETESGRPCARGALSVWAALPRAIVRPAQAAGPGTRPPARCFLDVRDVNEQREVHDVHEEREAGQGSDSRRTLAPRRTEPRKNLTHGLPRAYWVPSPPARWSAQRRPLARTRGRPRDALDVRDVDEQREARDVHEEREAGQGRDSRRTGRGGGSSPRGTEPRKTVRTGCLERIGCPPPRTMVRPSAGRWLGREAAHAMLSTYAM